MDDPELGSGESPSQLLGVVPLYCPSALAPNELPSVRFRSGKAAPRLLIAQLVSWSLGASEKSIATQPQLHNEVKNIIAKLDATDLDYLGQYIVRIESPKDDPDFPITMRILYIAQGPVTLHAVHLRIQNKAESTRREAEYQVLAECFRVYMSPLAHWFVSGIIDEQDGQGSSPLYSVGIRLTDGREKRSLLLEANLPNLGFDTRGRIEIPLPKGNGVLVIKHVGETEWVDSNQHLLTAPERSRRDRSEDRAACRYLALIWAIDLVHNEMRSILYDAMGAKRFWTAVEWRAIFVNNPLFHHFSTTLIWIAFTKNTQLGTFRLSTSGELATINDETFSLNDVAKVALVHPAGLTEADKKVWHQHLTDYKIIQPVAQIDKTTFRTRGEWAARVRKAVLSFPTESSWLSARSWIETPGRGYTSRELQRVFPKDNVVVWITLRASGGSAQEIRWKVYYITFVEGNEPGIRSPTIATFSVTRNDNGPVGAESEKIPGRILVEISDMILQHSL